MTDAHSFSSPKIGVRERAPSDPKPPLFHPSPGSEPRKETTCFFRYGYGRADPKEHFFGDELS